MFKARQDELLSVALFHGDVPGPHQLNFDTIEAWKYAGPSPNLLRDFQPSVVSEIELRDWLGQTEQYGTARLKKDNEEVLEGGLRVIFCERDSYRPPGFKMSTSSFLNIMDIFTLPSSTLDSIFNYAGTHSRNFQYSASGKLEKVRFVLKVPQKMPIGNYCLAFSYDIKTKTTTAFITGSFLQDVLPTMRQSILTHPLLYSTQRRAQDYIGFQIPNDAEEVTQYEQMESRLRCCSQHWTDPMIMPLIILENYLTRSKIFAQDLNDQVVDLERQTGVVFAARTVKDHERNIHPEQIPREKIQQLSQDMHTLLTEIINFENSVSWVVACSKFLQKNYEEITREESEILRNGEVIEMLEFMCVDAEGMCGLQLRLKDRVQSQINVLYTFMSQISNSINAKIAVSSARDSSAMKTLALITTVFLPGTYVATLFSMSMFDWSSSSSSSGSSSVSSKFWIYWVVTIPLTLFVMILWRIWWLWQERLYLQELNEAAGKAKSQPQTQSQQENPRRKPYLAELTLEYGSGSRVAVNYPLPDFNW